MPVVAVSSTYTTFSDRTSRNAVTPKEHKSACVTIVAIIKYTIFNQTIHFVNGSSHYLDVVCAGTDVVFVLWPKTNNETNRSENHVLTFDGLIYARLIDLIIIFTVGSTAFYLTIELISVLTKYTPTSSGDINRCPSPSSRI